METGINLIAKERNEQIEKHGFTLAHDKREDTNLLSYNAAVLSSPEVLYQKSDFANAVHFNKAETSKGWKLPDQHYYGNSTENNRCLNKNKEQKNLRIKQLIVAGALIAAEIDRLQNA